jgi:hypothetical protein
VASATAAIGRTDTKREAAAVLELIGDTLEHPLRDEADAHSAADLAETLATRWAQSGLPVACASLPNALVLTVSSPIPARELHVSGKAVLHRRACAGITTQREYFVRALVLFHGDDAAHGHWTCARGPGATLEDAAQAMAHRDTAIQTACAGSADARGAREDTLDKLCRSLSEANAGWVHLDDENWEWLPSLNPEGCPTLPGDARVAAVVLEANSSERPCL